MSRMKDLHITLENVITNKQCSDAELLLLRPYLDNDSGTCEDNAINQVLWHAVQNIHMGAVNNLAVRMAEAFIK